LIQSVFDKVGWSVYKTLDAMDAIKTTIMAINAGLLMLKEVASPFATGDLSAARAAVEELRAAYLAPTMSESLKSKMMVARGRMEGRTAGSSGLGAGMDEKSIMEPLMRGSQAAFSAIINAGQQSTPKETLAEIKKMRTLLERNAGRLMLIGVNF
jgi:hypothetical protein